MEEDNNQKSIEEKTVEDIGKKAGETTFNEIKKGTKLSAKKVVAQIAHALMSFLMAIPHITIILIVIALFCGLAFLLELFAGEDSQKAVYSSLGIVTKDDEKSYVAEAVKIVADNEGYHYEFNSDMDEKIENAIKEINKENPHISLEQKETIKSFIVAEAMTELPDLGGKAEGPNQFQGTIKIKRYTPDKKMGEVVQAQNEIVKTLKYVDEASFDNYLNSNNDMALETFTLVGDDKNLLTATWNIIERYYYISKKYRNGL